jgi:tricarballylate dehydrogenase
MSEQIIHKADVIVVGAGLSGLCAALTAHDQGKSVIVIERAPIEERGGNTRFSNGAMRAVYQGVEDIEALIGEIGEAERARADFGAYTREQYFDDLGRVTEYRVHPDMAGILVDRSRETMLWLRAQGVRFLPLYEWQFKLPDGRIKFSGGSAVECLGGGDGISASLFAACEKKNIPVHYDTRVLSLIEDANGVQGVWARCGGKEIRYQAHATVLACGGFEANAEMRTRYLGPSWDLARVRGSRFNTGDGLRMALDIGAMPYGHWSGCHASSWDFNAPETNELAFGTVFKRDDYLAGIVLNANGERFFDEGADIRSLTYAKLGRSILAQPSQIAWQIFDAKGSAQLHGEYRVRQSARFQAATLEELIGRLEGINREKALTTIRDFNAAVNTDIAYDPGRKDGRGTRGLPIPKSNWALALDEGPFEAYAVTCGITFTFGGLRIDNEGRVLDADARVISGLYAAGEMVGGLFYFNYPGGAGLMSAAVFGRVAGEGAAKA